MSRILAEVQCLLAVPTSDSSLCVQTLPCSIQVSLSKNKNIRLYFHIYVFFVVYQDPAVVYYISLYICMYMHISMYIYIDMCIYIYIMYMYKFMHVYKYICTHIYVHVYIYVHIYIYIYVKHLTCLATLMSCDTMKQSVCGQWYIYVYVCVCVCMCVYIYQCLHPIRVWNVNF